LPSSRREELASKVLKLIEENRDGWVKAAFFSDPSVSRLLDELHARWSAAGCRGIPLDYASEEELEVLSEKAGEYASMSSSEAMAVVLKRMEL